MMTSNDLHQWQAKSYQAFPKSIFSDSASQTNYYLLTLHKYSNPTLPSLIINMIALSCFSSL